MNTSKTDIMKTFLVALVFVGFGAWFGNLTYAAPKQKCWTQVQVFIDSEGFTDKRHVKVCREVKQ